MMHVRSGSIPLLFAAFLMSVLVLGGCERKGPRPSSRAENATPAIEKIEQETTVKSQKLQVRRTGNSEAVAQASAETTSSGQTSASVAQSAAKPLPAVVSLPVAQIEHTLKAVETKPGETHLGENQAQSMQEAVKQLAAQFEQDPSLNESQKTILRGAVEKFQEDIQSATETVTSETYAQQIELLREKLKGMQEELRQKQ